MLLHELLANRIVSFLPSVLQDVRPFRLWLLLVKEGAERCSAESGKGGYRDGSTPNTSQEDQGSNEEQNGWFYYLIIAASLAIHLNGNAENYVQFNSTGHLLWSVRCWWFTVAKSVFNVLWKFLCVHVYQHDFFLYSYFTYFLYFDVITF